MTASSVHTPRTVNRSRRAFSLLELLAVITIIGVIAAAIVPRISTSGVEAKKQMCTHRIHEVNKALEQYFVDRGEPATKVQQLAEIGAFPDGVPTCPLTGNGYLIDEETDRITTCPCATK